MISLETKTDATPSSPLGLSTPEKEPTLSFSQLLKGAGKKDDKVIQNGALVLSLGNEKDVKSNVITSSKTDTLLSLLKGKDAKEGDSIKVLQEPLELNPKITQNMTPKEIKALISDAKQYLKSKILDSDAYKQSQIKELPKTLKGLATLAKNYGIDISKVSIEEVQIKASQLSSAKIDVKADKAEAKTAPVVLSSVKESVKAPKIATETGVVKAQSKIQDQEIVEDKKINTKKEVESTKQTPLFKAQNIKEHTTEQIVTAREFKIEEKTPKEKADETLKMLLRGDKPSVSSSGLTADFSVATARVIAPNATSDASRSLEKLLHGETSSEHNNGSNAKLENSATLKADSFEVKLNEAKQMIKYISQDVKTAIEDYKSPFTRVKVQLNPQKLGEVDLTIVQRGKNLHVSISSNNTAINTLSMNANELKVQLSNNGINNATLNFNSSSQNGDSNPGQQQNRQNEKRADEEYNYFENEEQNEEVLSSLEIVVPNYA
ncbi:flagellar hook-length control protein [Sulfurimonas gotlandica GD1]|uniref:Flagellar hook-length control protein n=1 Tax=Sulfurimonas gotlandica (strain DSM 19862 / JCM 16533 / GD1) TaxID=929558 RepID=B6BH23_SULGG|nr:flagellar hook-length control protein FliK [Sulfurimonas gotlandica]EDZ62844.1 flagellar hook-length control protein [Sulfurimonas gotlandica GD1]EHP29810.1 flagellar hook-length control protein [Sulfurimonas gotlandica GD1]